jgi:general secretion pathway protein C
VDPYAPPRSNEPMTVEAPAKAEPLKPVYAPGSPSAPEVIRADVLNVKRSELESALSDFARLSKDVGFTKLPRGVQLGTVASTSYLWKLGLRSGDIVTALDGKPLRTLDDAAAAYARLGSAQKLAVDVERGNARGTLRFTLK